MFISLLRLATRWYKQTGTDTHTHARHANKDPSLEQLLLGHTTGTGQRWHGFRYMVAAVSDHWQRVWLLD